MNQLKFSHIMQQADLLAALLFACMAYAQRADRHPYGTP